MNTKNNKRHLETMENIEKAFIYLLKEKELDKISVTELCEIAGVERSTFYANYEDVSALANEIAAKIEKQLNDQPHTDGDFAWIFEYIKANKELFKIYFKLGISQIKTDYKMIFFRTGVYAVVKMWFEEGCTDSSEEMSSIILREYNKLRG